MHPLDMPAELRGANGPVHQLDAVLAAAVSQGPALELCGIVQVQRLRQAMHRPVGFNADRGQPRLLGKSNAAEQQRDRASVRSLHGDIDGDNAPGGDVDGHRQPWATMARRNQSSTTSTSDCVWSIWTISIGSVATKLPGGIWAPGSSASNAAWASRCSTSRRPTVLRPGAGRAACKQRRRISIQVSSCGWASSRCLGSHRVSTSTMICSTGPPHACRQASGPAASGPPSWQPARTGTAGEADTRWSSASPASCPPCQPDCASLASCQGA